MSNNIIRFQVRSRSDFVVQYAQEVEELFDDEATITLEADDLIVKMSGGSEVGQLIGTLRRINQEWLIEVRLINWGGVSSGSRWEDFREILEECSSGTLRARLVYEDGEVYNLTVVDGQVTLEQL